MWSFLTKLMAVIAGLLAISNQARSEFPNGNIPRNAKPRLDRYGDPLPAGALQRYGSVRFRFADTIVNAAMSADGKALAVATNPPTVHVLDPSTGLLLRKFPLDTASVLSVHFAPGNKELVTQHDRNLVLFWDVATGKRLRKFQLKSPGFRLRTILHGDARSLVVADWKPNQEKTIVGLWDLATGKRLERLTTPRPHSPGPFSRRAHVGLVGKAFGRRN